MSEQLPTNRIFERLYTNKNKAIAAGLSAIALAGIMSPEARTETSKQQEATKVERTENGWQDIKVRDELLRKLSEGKLPNKVLSIAITFSVLGLKEKLAYIAPKKGVPDTGLSTATIKERGYFLGRDPRYLHYAGADWLIFTHQAARDSAPNAESRKKNYGVAKDYPATVFLNVDYLPKGTKIWTGKEYGLTGRIIPAEVTERGDVVGKNANDILDPGTVQFLTHTNDKAAADNLIKAMGLKQTNMNLKGLK